MLRKTTFLLASISAMLCLGFASLAYAGEDGDDDDQPPAPPVQTAPVPPPPAPKPAPKPAPQPEQKSSGSGESGPSSESGSSNREGQSTSPTPSPVADTQVSSVPVGGVQAGGGATADEGAATGLLGLGAGLVLVALAGGGLALRRRPDEA
jgi:hypothetical protein